MKRLILAIILIPLLSASDCNSDKLPACIKRIISDAKKNPDSAGPVQIDEYRYRDKRVFLFTAPCCDQYNTVYDINCDPVCAPSGGITGRGDGKCSDFDSIATFVRNLWKKGTQ